MVQQVLTSEDKPKLKVTPLSGVDLNDAAARLKSRAEAGSGDDNIFEILPRFAISGEDVENWETQYIRRRDEVLAVSGGDATGIGVGCALISFEKEREEPSQQMHFSAPIDFILWRRSILLLGLSSSEVVLVDPGTYKVKYAWTLKENCEGNRRFYVDAFIHHTPDPTKIDVVIVAVNGSVYRIRNVSLSDGTLDSTHDQNVSLDIDFGTIKDIQEFEFAIKSEVVSVSSPSRNKIILIEKCGRVTIADLKDETDDAILNSIPSIEFEGNIFSCLSRQVAKSVFPTKVVSCEGLLFILLSNGALEIFSFEALTLPAPTMTVHDFKLVPNNNEGTVKLWVLYRDTGASGDENYLGIFKGPDFQPEFIFQLPVLDLHGSLFKFSSDVSPFEEPTTIVEMAPSEVRMHYIMETSTDVTLQKLLSRGKYAEAHDLALNYNKDLNIVKKVEARDKLNKVISYLAEGKHSSAETEYFKLLDVLRSITDAEFICQFCVEAEVQKLEWVKEVLGLGKARVSECRNSGAARTLLLILKKLYTFELVYPSGSICDWNSFVSTDMTMFMQTMKFLQSGNFDKCERVWTRHSEEFVPDITLRDFLPFFDILFDHQLKSSASISLLKTILPYSIDKVAAAAMSSSDNDANQGHDSNRLELNVLLSIILRQVSTLESKVDWPVNALDFIKVLISVVGDEMTRLETSRTEKPSSLLKKKTIVEKLQSKLLYIEQVLEELGELKKSHSIRILFNDYTQNKVPEVISKLLYKLLSKEEVEGFVSKYLRPYAERKRLDMDFLLFEHIKSVLQTIHYYIQVSSIPHEERIICLVHLIASTETKLRCILQISEEWPVPWTAGIDNMVKQSLANISRESLSPICIQLYDSIATMRKQVPYRCVINKYKMNGSKLVLSRVYVTMALLRMLKLKKPGYYEDCKELLKNVVGGRRFEDEFRLEFLEFTLKMNDEMVDEEDVLPVDPTTRENLRKTMIHRLELELEIMEENSSEYDSSRSYSLEEGTKAEQKRFLTLYKYVAAECKDPRKNVAARLKEVLPTLPLGIIYREDFPFVILQSFLEDSEVCSNPPSQLIENCKKLCQITNTYLPDMLLVVGEYFTREGLAGNPSAYLWCIVEYIVESPVNLNMSTSPTNKELLNFASGTIATKLLLQCPKLSLEQMETLHEFLCLICSTFDKLCETIASLLCFYRIFLNLKEQEIPLENAFLAVYKWVSGPQNTSSWESIKPTFNSIGETLIKFGETDVYFSVFNCVQRHLLNHVSKLDTASPQGKAAITFYENIIGHIKSVKQTLWAQVPNIKVEEVDCKFKALVQDLGKAGIKVNAYALKLRNKVKLLERLLKFQNYILAADLAITFELYDEHAIWSRILMGCTLSHEVDELRRVLETIRTVPQLWMLNEFAEAWKKVSAVDADFYHLCPIPLD